mmetsp:Transcript_31339/g.43475  ORF Transcript_31339/g.43475 Transcript_31339/m.43475 type:complete len:304 (+) Transcript_31339:112-1023(+)|eukprot:CAMPEP_0196596414 /NCGR_PEP_ID=MMETSP1081-20130531/85973_1 /TAXON_ID=36882 /ORGANISM="Pyramimonas amylifera, Strain CCMP720" /LENGTH=303 /DNA_ID=CAMNT_0041921405 /DNA_START=19 /DNA_END=930 /DNA_ORIENTATION=+
METPKKNLTFGALISASSLKNESSAAEKAGSLLVNAGAGSKWKKVQQTVNTTSQMRRAGRKKLEENPSALQRRQSYNSEVLDKIPMRTHLRLHRGTVQLTDIVSLKSYFDDLDIDGNGVVTTEEMAIHRQSKVPGSAGAESNDSIFKILMNLNEEVSFQAMIKLTHPDFTDNDVKICVEALNGKFQDTSHEDAKVSIASELREIEDMWALYADADGTISFDRFLEAVKKIGQKLTYNETIDVYDEFANPNTDMIHKKEFTLWWVNMNRVVPLLWEEIREEAEEHWEDVVDEDTPERKSLNIVI